MKAKIRILGTVAAAMAALALTAARPAAACPDCDKHKMDASPCPAHVKGAEVKVANTNEGVVITITAKDKEAVSAIQASAAKMGKGGDCGCDKKGHGGKAHGGKAHGEKAHGGKGMKLSHCPMKDCWHGERPKDGKCPHCGMAVIDDEEGAKKEEAKKEGKKEEKK